MGGGQQVDARELQEAHGQPTDDAGHVCHARQAEEECSHAGGGEVEEEHLAGFALGDDGETSERFFGQDESLRIWREVQIGGDQIWS